MHRYFTFFFRGKFFVWRGGGQKTFQTEEGIMLQSFFGRNTIYLNLAVQPVCISRVFCFSSLCVHTLLSTWLKLSCMFWIFSCPSANLRISYFLLKTYVQSLRSGQSCLKCNKSACFRVNFFSNSTSILPFPWKIKIK